MTVSQVEIKQGIAKTFRIDMANYPPLQSGVTWKAALVNPSTNVRYESDEATKSGTVVSFHWPSGLVDDAEDPDYGKMDESCPNGTAWMTVGNYNFELYTSDHSDMGVLYGRFHVVDSNLMAKDSSAEVSASEQQETEE